MHASAVLGAKLCVECVGYTYNLVHVQTHSVPAPFTADVSTRPDRVAYDADGHAFDTNTKLDKEQARARSQLTLWSVLRWRGKAATSRLLSACCSNVLLPACCQWPVMVGCARKYNMRCSCPKSLCAVQVATTEHFLNQVFKPRATSEGAQVLDPSYSRDPRSAY